jgi:hypothetical protein
VCIYILNHFTIQGNTDVLKAIELEDELVAAAPKRAAPSAGVPYMHRCIPTQTQTQTHTHTHTHTHTNDYCIYFAPSACVAARAAVTSAYVCVCVCVCVCTYVYTYILCSLSRCRSKGCGNVRGQRVVYGGGEAPCKDEQGRRDGVA